MNTALFEVVSAIPNRIAELENLLEHSKIILLVSENKCNAKIKFSINSVKEKFKENDCNNEMLYNSLCRSLSVLIVSHLEGFLKDLSKALIDDLNYNAKSFSEMPDALKRNFCERIAFYEGISDAERDAKAKQLMVFFNENSVRVDFTPFKNKENGNKNPSPNFIDGFFSKFGINQIFFSLATPEFYAIFDNDYVSEYKLKRLLKKSRSLIYKYPYGPFDKDFNFTHRVERKNRSKVEKTLWHDFVDNILTIRHKVAHGDTLTNEITAEEIGRNIKKLEVLMHGLTLSAACFFFKKES